MSQDWLLVMEVQQLEASEKMRSSKDMKCLAGKRHLIRNNKGEGKYGDIVDITFW
jgi:hypothetical protein